MCLKHHAPFKCNYVPEDVLIMFFNKYPEICRIIFWNHFVMWLMECDFRNHSPSQMRAADKKYWLHPLVKFFTFIVQKELNFENTTLQANHIYHRFGRVYRRVNNLDWRKHGERGWTFVGHRSNLKNI